MAGTITISSSYGADGAAIGTEVAARLGMSFYDRAIPVAVARELDIGTDDALARDWRAPGRMERVLSAFASASPFEGADPKIELASNTEVYRKATEDVLRSIADGEGGVILGRASMIVLEKRPDVLSVRFDGPAEARIRLVVERGDAPESQARHEQKITDDARESYAQVFYGRSQHDTGLYHLAIDRTALSHAACVELVLRAAADRLGLVALSTS